MEKMDNLKMFFDLINTQGEILDSSQVTVDAPIISLVSTTESNTTSFRVDQFVIVMSTLIVAEDQHSTGKRVYLNWLILMRKVL